MSKMLKEAIIDATALREAAIKNAEEMIVEKYAPKIEEAVKQLLEQNVEDEFNRGDNIEIAPMKSAIDSDMPLAANQDDRPDQDEEVEIDFEELEKKMKEEEPSSKEMLDREQVATALEEKQEEKVVDTKEEDEEYELDEEEIKDIVKEELNVDIKLVPDGYIGTVTVPDEPAWKAELAMAKLNDTKVKEEMEQLKKDMKDLQEAKVKSEKEKEAILQENKQYKEVVEKIKTKLEESNISNARLLYINKVLNSNSLNGQQKEKLVEAILKAERVEDAKMIYETMRSTMESVTRKEMSNNSKSLTEIVNKKSVSTLVMQRNNNSSSENEQYDSLSERMKLLAGIDKKSAKEQK